MNNKIRLIVRECLEELLNENKKEIITNKLKLPNFVADWINNISEKFSIWFANEFKKNFLLEEVPDEFTRSLLIKQLEKGNTSGGMEKLLRKYMNSIEGEYRYISDWLNGRTQGINPERDTLNLKTLTFEEALGRANAWHEMLAQQEFQKIEDEDGEIVLRFPNKFYWVNLGKRRCDKEARAMGHCGSAEGTLFSLRKEGQSYVTADILPNGVVKQMRGRANTKPKTEYHPYIIELLKSSFIKGFDYNSYRSNDNFYLKDLNKEEYQNLILQKPSLVKGQNILKNLDIDVLIELLSKPYFRLTQEDYNQLSNIYSFETINEFIDKYPHAFYTIRI